ncbi:unnamed protein product [Rotaria magnacalcarata]
MDSTKAEAENIEPSAGKELLDKYWTQVKHEIDDINIVEFRTTDLPLARIKKIMKLDDDVKMISAEVPILFAKAAELFIQELTIHSWLQTEESRRRTLQRNDVAAAIAKNELFDFLIDIVPREEATKTHKKKDTVSEVQYIVTLPSSGAMGNTIQLPNGQIIQLPQNLSSNIVTMATNASVFIISDKFYFFSYSNYRTKMNSYFTDFESTTKFDWIARIRAILQNSNGEAISFDKLKKRIIKEYRQAKPDSDKSTKELTIELENKLAKAPFITRLGNDIYYLYYFKNEKINSY